VCVRASSGIRGYNSAWPAPALAGRFIFYVLYQHTHTLLWLGAAAKDSAQRVCVCILLFTLVFFTEGRGGFEGRWVLVTGPLFKSTRHAAHSFFSLPPRSQLLRDLFLYISWILIVRFEFNSNKSQTRRSSAHRAHTRTLARLPWLFKRPKASLT
jgi:hypothetical protein